LKTCTPAKAGKDREICRERQSFFVLN